MSRTTCTCTCTCSPETRAADTDTFVTAAAVPALVGAQEGTVTARSPREGTRTGSEPCEAVSGDFRPHPIRPETVYISGPMTGLLDFNRPAFNAAAKALRDAGYAVVNPAEVNLGPDGEWEDYMRIHLGTIVSGKVDRLGLLPGFELSQGAMLECSVAEALGIPCEPWQEWLVEPAPAPVDEDALFPVDTHDTQPTDPGCGCSTNPARARYADGDPAGCYCTCSDDAREGCEHEPDEPQSSDQEASS